MHKRNVHRTNESELVTEQCTNPMVIEQIELKLKLKLKLNNAPIQCIMRQC